jgi:FlaA1/EpsC-like NDP-sugar epimerase
MYPESESLSADPVFLNAFISAQLQFSPSVSVPAKETRRAFLERNIVGVWMMTDRDLKFNMMRGRLVLITGATAGIGKAVADELAGSGAELFIHGRDKRKLCETETWLSGRHPGLIVRGFCADFEV